MAKAFAQPEDDLSSTWDKARTFGKLLLRPESWPIEILFIIGANAVFKLVTGEPLVDVLSWTWATVSTVMAHPVILALLVPFAVLMFWRGVNRVIARDADNMARETEVRLDAYRGIEKEFDLNRDLATLVAYRREETAANEAIGKLERQLGYVTERLIDAVPAPGMPNWEYADTVAVTLRDLAFQFEILNEFLQDSDRFPPQLFEPPSFQFSDLEAPFKPEDHSAQMQTLRDIAAQIQGLINQGRNIVARSSLLHREALQRIRDYAGQKRQP